LNRCDTVPACSNTDGSAVNAASCMCGLNDCMPVGQSVTLTKRNCLRYAKVQFPTVTTLQEASLHASFSPGCSYFNNKAYWNTDTTAPIHTSYTLVTAGSNGLFCVSALNKCNTVPACTNNDGIALNPGNCTCGTNDCDSSNGLYCVSASNRCEIFPTCSNNDGTAINPGKCMCGTNDCDSSSGLFCVSSASRCAKGPDCSNNDGSAVNEASCMCGSNDCLPGQSVTLTKGNCLHYAKLHFPTVTALTESSISSPGCSRYSNNAYWNANANAAIHYLYTSVPAVINRLYCVAELNYCDSYCPKGQYRNDKDGDCTDCPKGRWSNTIDIMSPDQCELCSMGRYGDTTGITSNSACIACKGNFFSVFFFQFLKNQILYSLSVLSSSW